CWPERSHCDAGACARLCQAVECRSARVARGLRTRCARLRDENNVRDDRTFSREIARNLEKKPPAWRSARRPLGRFEASVAMLQLRCFPNRPHRTGSLLRCIYGNSRSPAAFTSPPAQRAVRERTVRRFQQRRKRATQLRRSGGNWAANTIWLLAESMSRPMTKFGR